MTGRRRSADDRVSDALDRLTNRRFELEAAIRSMLAVWDGIGPPYDPPHIYRPGDWRPPVELADAVAALRELVPPVGTQRA